MRVKQATYTSDVFTLLMMLQQLMMMMMMLLPLSFIASLRVPGTCSHAATILEEGGQGIFLGGQRFFGQLHSALR